MIPNIVRKKIFVFGSNLAGRHGAGSAKEAREKWGAHYGQGTGLQGRSYAIPTKDRNLKTMKLSDIQPYVTEFIAFALEHRNMDFFVVKIGCGLAGYSEKQMMHLFINALHANDIEELPFNVKLMYGN